jgi:CheY-like chemotaxis protein
VHVQTNRSILLIEDDCGIRESVAECLQAVGYSVIPVSNGEEGLSAARAQRPNLIVCDLVMPVMNGAQFVDALRRDTSLRDIPVVLMTGAVPSRGMTVPPADGYLAKPFELEELLEAVERHCGARA